MLLPLLLSVLFGCAHRADLSSPAAPLTFTRQCLVWNADRVAQEWQAQIAAKLGVSPSRVIVRVICGVNCDVTATVIP